MVQAFVFWHVPLAGTDLEVYAAGLVRFQAALARSAPKGFLGAETRRLSAVPPWCPAAEAAFEDWYVVMDTAALDALDRGAVAEGMRPAHDAAASAAAWGRGGLYAALDGTDMPVPGARLWLDKPRGVPYAAFAVDLRAALFGRGRLWRRRMSLGPAPEICVSGIAPDEGAVLTLPAAWHPYHAPGATVWPEG